MYKTLYEAPHYHGEWSSLPLELLPHSFLSFASWLGILLGISFHPT